MIGYWIGGIVAALVIVLLAIALPDLIRYIRISRM